MCGIIGYAGNRDAERVLLKGLKRLEYRGYDSAGIAVIQEGEVAIDKKQGKLHVLTDDLQRLPLEGNVGIGHTRWATHGVPSERNAHPHADCSGKIACVHNGIIENYQALKRSLIKEGHKFISDTDTEVIPHLIEKFYKGDLADAARKTTRLLKGAYAIACIHRDEPHKIVGARVDSPLIVGVGKGEMFLASDAPAILDYTREVIFLDNNEVVEIQGDAYRITDQNAKALRRKSARIKWDISQAEKAGFRHFMLKEIFEQPDVMAGILKERLKNGGIRFEELALKDNVFKSIKRIVVVACGTAYHAGLVGKYALEKYTRLPVWVDTSSEFRYREPVVDKKSLVIIISQSGETADSLAALREARRMGAKTLAICNVLGSSIARESDSVIYTHAGPEIAVASTKAYTAQLAILYLFTIYLGTLRGTLKPKDKARLLREIKKTPRLMKKFLGRHHSANNQIARYANEFRKYYLKMHHKSCFLILGRNINYPNTLEGALKLKEISYISAEGYPAGEMKHGPIALIDENPWVVCIAVKSGTYDKMLSNIQEIKARRGIVITISSENDKIIKNQGINYDIKVPVIDEFFSPLLVAIPLQLLAYYVAREFGYDIDQPRNLAKSVTVE